MKCAHEGAIGKVCACVWGEAEVDVSMRAWVWNGGEGAHGVVEGCAHRGGMGGVHVALLCGTCAVYLFFLWFFQNFQIFFFLIYDFFCIFYTLTLSNSKKTFFS